MRDLLVSTTSFSKTLAWFGFAMNSFGKVKTILQSTFCGSPKNWLLCFYLPYSALILIARLTLLRVFLHRIILQQGKVLEELIRNICWWAFSGFLWSLFPFFSSAGYTTLRFFPLISLGLKLPLYRSPFPQHSHLLSPCHFGRLWPCWCFCNFLLFFGLADHRYPLISGWNRHHPWLLWEVSSHT